MLRVALKDLMARKRRLVTTGLAVVLGIAFLTGTQVLSTVLKDSIDSLITDVYAGYDAVVRSPEVQDVGFGQQLRASVGADLVDAAADVDGVRTASGVVEATSAQLIGSDGKIVGSDFGPPTIVYNWLGGELQQGTLTEGRPPELENEIVLEFAAAQNAGYDLGDEVRINGPEGMETFTLVGLAGLGPEGDRSSGARPLFFLTPVAQRLGQVPGQFTYVAVSAVDGVDQTELAENLAAALPGQQVVTGEQFTAENAEGIAQFVDILSTFVMVFGYVALFVACFIIYNTFSILVAQRTRETALLRAIGARRRQVLAATLAEAAAVGLVASLLGLAGGAALATLLKAFVGRLFTVEPGVPSLPGSAVVIALAVGLLITMASAIVPALRSSKVPPIAAMSEVAVDRTSLSLARVVWGSVFVLGGAALVTLGLTDTGPNPLLEFGIGAALILISVAVILGPLIASPVSRFLAAPFGRSVTGRLAGENAARNPKRTAATAAALTIGVTLVTLIAVVASSVRSSVDQAISDRITADYVVNSVSFSFGVGIPPTAVEEIRQIPAVDVASPVRFSPVRLLDDFGKERAARTSSNGSSMLGGPIGAPDGAPEGEDDFAVGFDPETFFRVTDPGELEGAPEDLGPGTFAATRRVAEERGWELGDQIPFYFAQTGVQELELALTIENELGQSRYLLPMPTFESNVLPLFAVDFVVYVQAAEGATENQLEEMRESLDALFADSPNIAVQNLSEYAEAQTAPLDTFLAIVYGLLGLAVIIALIGIANTLSLSVLERTRELGLLRAVGMSRRQLRRTILGESIIIAVFGTLIGLVIGILFSLALSVVIAAESPGLFRYDLPVIQLIVITVVAALAGVLAALLPAWRASRLDVLDAISSV
jgi:putative ABC transport system permease protein